MSQPPLQPVLFQEIACANGHFVGRATLNNEKAINSLTLEMIDALAKRLAAWQDDPRIACVFLDGAGDKGFCAGGDVRKLYESAVRCGVTKPNDYARDFFGREYRLDYLIHTYRKPVVVWGGGIVMGGGVGLMGGASHRIVTETTRLAMPEISIGLFPDVGGSWLLNRMPGRSGLFLGITGSHCNGADALFLGLADRAIPEAWRKRTFDALVAARWTGSAEDNHVVAGRVLRNVQTASGVALPLSNVRGHIDVIQEITDAGDLPTVMAQLHANTSHDPWLQRARKTARAGCPVTAHLVWEQLRRAKHLSLANVFRMELVVAVQCLRHPDFAEGVRALLIDKDNQPKWQHPNAGAVPRSYVEEFFASPFDEHPLADL